MPSRNRPPARVGALRQVLLLAMLLALVGATPGHAYSYAGQRWPNKVITVSNGAPAYERAVSRAMRAWNASRVGVRFERGPRSRARVRVVYAGGAGGWGLSGCEGVNGAALAGYPGPTFLATVISVRRTCRSRGLRAVTLVHEFGHVLGLGHDDRRCAVMNRTIIAATSVPLHCRGQAAARFRRTLLSPDDIRGASALYRRRAPSVDPSVAYFNPGDGTRRRLSRGSVGFRAAFRNRGLSYQWRFGDPDSGRADSATGLNARHRFRGRGSYTVTLEVSDGGAVIAKRRQRLTLF